MPDHAFADIGADPVADTPAMLQAIHRPDTPLVYRLVIYCRFYGADHARLYGVFRDPTGQNFL